MARQPEGENDRSRGDSPGRYERYERREKGGYPSGPKPKKDPKIPDGFTTQQPKIPDGFITQQPKKEEKEE
jgi:hypothetical protein